MEITLKLLTKIIPYIFIGWLFTKLKLKNTDLFIRYFVNFALYFLVPIFVFFAMWEAPLLTNVVNTRNVVFAVLVVFFFGVLFALCHSKIFGQSFRSVALPIIFMNSAYIAIPLNTVFFGTEGTFYAIIYNVGLTFLYFIFGVWFVSGSIKEMFRLPIMYLAIFGIFLNLSGIKLSTEIHHFSELLTAITIPVMLCLVGCQMRTDSIFCYKGLKKVLTGVFMRMFGGLIVAYIFCRVFDITGVVKGVCLLTSAMPSAISSYIFSKKYDADYSFASSMITIGLIMTLVVIPIILWLK